MHCILPTTLLMKNVVVIKMAHLSGMNGWEETTVHVQKDEVEQWLNASSKAYQRLGKGRGRLPSPALPPLF